MLYRLPAFHRAGLLNAVIETPRGSRNKFTFEPESGTFRLGKQLPAVGLPVRLRLRAVHACRRRRSPRCAGALGDPTFPGCVVRARVVGVIDGEQTSRSGKTATNPRLIAVATKSTEYAAIRRLNELPQSLIDEITHFFVSYNAAAGKTYRPTGAFGPRTAASMIEAGIRRRQNAVARTLKRRRPMPHVA